MGDGADDAIGDDFQDQSTSEEPSTTGYFASLSLLLVAVAALFLGHMRKIMRDDPGERSLEESSSSSMGDSSPSAAASETGFGGSRE
jgi:hypothetical protein